MRNLSKSLLLGAGFLFSPALVFGNGEIGGARFSSCGKTSCVTIESSRAFSSHFLLLYDFPESTLRIRSINKLQIVSHYSAQELFVDLDGQKIIMRKVAQLSGDDAVYDLRSEQLTRY